MKAKKQLRKKNNEKLHRVKNEKTVKALSSVTLERGTHN